MSRVEIRPIQLPRDTVAFVKAWWPIYADDPLWVPPLIFERKDFFNPKKNPYHQHADIQCFMAWKDGKPVGTISAQVDHAYQEIEAGIGFFGFFEFIDDEEVAQGLMDAACAWLREQGMEEARGPFNFNTNHEFGCLIDGFDTPPAIANPHNREYYPRIYEAIGMDKSKDWYAYWLDNEGGVPDRIRRISDRFEQRHPEVTIRKLSKKDFPAEKDRVHEIYDDAWSDNWGHSHMSPAEFEFMANGVKQLLDPDLAYIAFVGDEPAAVAITLPDYNQVVTKMNGRLFPFGWWHFLFGRSAITQIRVWILGVKLKYQHLPLGAPLYVRTWDEGSKRNITGAEASLILEDNHRMRGALEKLGARVYKTYRIWSRGLLTAEELGDDYEEDASDAPTELLHVIPPDLLDDEPAGGTRRGFRPGDEHEKDEASAEVGEAILDEDEPE